MPIAGTHLSTSATPNVRRVRVEAQMCVGHNQPAKEKKGNKHDGKENHPISNTAVTGRRRTKNNNREKKSEEAKG